MVLVRKGQQVILHGLHPQEVNITKVELKAIRVMTDIKVVLAVKAVLAVTAVEL